MSQIQRDDENQRYFVIGRSQMAYIPFLPLSGNRVLFVQVLVPQELRGKGLAEDLCIFAFSDAKRRGLTVLSSCTYIINRFIPRNPEYGSIFTSIPPSQSEFLIEQQSKEEPTKPISPSSQAPTETADSQLKSNRLPKGFKFTLLPHHPVYKSHWNRLSEICNRSISTIDELFEAFSYLYQESHPNSSLNGRPFPRGSFAATLIEPLCRYLGRLSPEKLQFFFESTLPIIQKAAVEFPELIEADCNWGDSHVIPVLCHLDFSSTALAQHNHRDALQSAPYGFSIADFLNELQAVVRYEVEDSEAIISHNTNQPHVEPSRVTSPAIPHEGSATTESTSPETDLPQAGNRQEEACVGANNADEAETTKVEDNAITQSVEADTSSYPTGFFFAPCISKLVLSRKTVMSLLAIGFFGIPPLSSNLQINGPLSHVFASELFDSCGLDRYIISNLFPYTTSQSVHAKLSSVLSYFTYFPDYTTITGCLEYIWNENMMNVDFAIDQLLGRQRFRNDLFLRHRQIQSGNASGDELTSPPDFDQLPCFLQTPVVANISNLPDILHRFPGTTRQYYTPLPKMFTVDEYISDINLYHPSRYSEETQKQLLFTSSEDSPYRRWLYGDACRQVYQLLLRFSRMQLVGSVVGSTTGDNAQTYTNTGVLKVLHEVLPHLQRLATTTPGVDNSDPSSGVVKCLTTSIPTTFDAFQQTLHQSLQSPDAIVDDFRYLFHDATYNVNQKLMRTEYPHFFQENGQESDIPPSPSLATAFIRAMGQLNTNNTTQIGEEGDEYIHTLQKAIAYGSDHAPASFKVESVSNEHLPTSLLCDFANKYIGGTVLTTGCVQEEIVFVEHAETLVSLLFTSVMLPKSAVKIIGAVKHGVCGGYATSLFFSHPLTASDCEHSFAAQFIHDKPNQSSPQTDQAPLTSQSPELFTTAQQQQKREMSTSSTRQYGPYPVTCILAIDAEPYGNLQSQFTWPKLRRELIKLLAGLSVTYSYVDYDAQQYLKAPTVNYHYPTTFVTGNWGAGVFGGCPQMKSILQWVGCGISDVYMRYLPMGDRRTAGLHRLLQLCYDQKIRVCDAFIVLLLTLKNGVRDFMDSRPTNNNSVLPPVIAIEKVSELLLVWYGSTLRLKSRWFLLHDDNDKASKLSSDENSKAQQSEYNDIDEDEHMSHVYDSPLENPIGYPTIVSCYSSLRDDLWGPFAAQSQQYLAKGQSPVYAGMFLLVQKIQSIIDAQSATVPQ